MNHPDKPSSVSFSFSGEIEEEPENIIALVVENEDGDPVEILEKWSADAWISASTDDLIKLN